MAFELTTRARRTREFRNRTSCRNLSAPLALRHLLSRPACALPRVVDVSCGTLPLGAVLRERHAGTSRTALCDGVLVAYVSLEAGTQQTDQPPAPLRALPSCKRTLRSARRTRPCTALVVRTAAWNDAAGTHGQRAAVACGRCAPGRRAPGHAGTAALGLRCDCICSRCRPATSPSQLVRLPLPEACGSPFSLSAGDEFILLYAGSGTATAVPSD